MKKITIKKHLPYYFSLIAIQALGSLLILMNTQNRNTEIALVVLTTAIYTIWAIIHQYINHQLSAKIVFEYILIGGLGVSLFLFALK